MKHFAKKHKYHLGTLLLLLTVVSVSAFFAFPRYIVVPEVVPEVEEIAQRTSSAEVIQEQESNVKVYNTLNKTLVTPKDNDSYTLVKQADTSHLMFEPDINEQYTIPTTLVVQDSVYKFDILPDSSIFVMMEGIKDKTNLDYKVRNFGSGLGYFIEEINGVKQNPRKGLYWIYYINGQKATKGISNYTVQPNDVITWKYEEDENI